MTQLIAHNLRFLHPTSLFRELVLLDEIAANHRVTQSALASRAGIVPAMVNNYIKTFIKKGYISVQGNNRDMRYTITNAGEAHRFSLLLSYFRETVGLYKNVKEEIQTKLNEFLAEGIRSIVLYGAAETAEITLNAADCIGLKVIGVVDGNVNKQGREFFGNIIEAPSKIEEIMPDAVVISSSGHQEEIYRQIKQYESRGIKIRKL
ncbi:MAG: MarR family transcriptional regulator [Candidatus Omnitrophica bacterium]|nr:MarR family transcriptional regulator [Candidatus Omnitrophota bacterium]